MLEAEGWVVSVLTQKMSALQMRVVDLNSKASAAPTQVWCLEGVEGVLVGDGE